MINFDDSTSVQQDEQDDNPLKEWRSKFESGTLNKSDIFKFFHSTAPNFFEVYPETDTVQDNLTERSQESMREFQSVFPGDKNRIRCNFNESGAKTAIIDILEEFICGDNPQNVLEKLKSEGNVPSVCGRVFRVGEPTYSCRECGMDPTCVLCVNCFKQSAHRYHKYKMSTSSGGGCCDCGDIEAWKQDQYCEEHIRGKEIKSESSVITSRMIERCELAFGGILMYCVKFLEIESTASLECLDGGRDEDVFCTVLYNDESHTFEQVIQTLIKIVKCTQKDAMEYVTSIDREGRAVVKCDSFEACVSLKEAIEKQPMRHSSNVNRLSPLKVSVLHKNAVSCQQFALQLLSWFQEFLTRHATFRSIFATVANDKRGALYNIGHILEYDWKLWKTARSCWHRLLISGMLMEYENKKILSIEFTKHYATIIQDFIRDDHDHSFSVVSLSVQLFTVPTIAHYLIAYESVFYKLMHTFYWESIEKHVQNKTLHFAKNTANLNVFKRAAYILFDLRYILSFKPDIWTTDLVDGFLDGVNVLLKLLNVMQGMDSVYRQTGQHMDYEPEWESGFNLHIKLASVISLVLEWCSTDREVLIKVYQMTMDYLLRNEFIVGAPVIKEQKRGEHNAHCLMYDVSANHVSIHLPLSRFFVGIYLLLGKFGLNYDNTPAKVTKRTPEEIMEPVLCTQTMIAQVHSGMWRRNGYSLLHQLYYYRNVRCRSEMLDRDIAALQIGAALIESNQYLIHILNKFNLLKWAGPNYEPLGLYNNSDDDHIRQLNMIDEFLELLIVIIGERYVPGIGDVTEEDRIKKEIIQQLCIKSFSHSELNRTLPDTNHETVLEDVIDTLATFKKPSQSNAKGVYELKDEFYEDYNMYYYHYTKEEKSKSEESQRIRRKAKGQLVCCPPPKLPKLAEGFVSIANLLQCDVMLGVMSTVLKRALDLKAKSFTESHLQKTLHLIGYALQEEESTNYPFLTYYDRAVSAKYEILQLLEKLTHSARVEAHRDFIIWTVKKFKELQPKLNESEMESDETAANQPMTTAEAEKYEKEERAKIAAERRAKIMAQMANAQKNFMKSNAELFASTSTAAAANENMDWQTADEEVAEEHEPNNKSIACLGSHKKLQSTDEQKFKCILCFEDCAVSKDGPCLVYSAFIQKSKVLSTHNSFNDDIPAAPHTGTCGHVMHASCWKEYFDNEILKENRRPNRNRSPNNFIVDKKEFLCPYCRCLSNAVIPLTPSLSQFSPSTTQPACDDTDNVVSFENWIMIMRDYLEELYAIEQHNDFGEDGKEYKAKFVNMDDIVQKYAHLGDFSRICTPIYSSKKHIEWSLFAEIFMASVQRVAPYPHAAEECEPYLVVWNSCAYTIQSLEMNLRAINKAFKNDMSIRHSSCLTGLIRVCGMIAACIEENIADKLMIHLRGILETVLLHKGTSCAEWDVFQMLATLVFMVPATMYSYKRSYVVPCGNYLEYYFLKLMFCANIAKAIVLYRTDDIPTMDVDPFEDDLHQKAQQPSSSTSTSASASSSSAFGTLNSSNLTNNKKSLDNLLAFYKKYNLQIREKQQQHEGVASAAEEEEQNDITVSPLTAKHLLEHIKDECKIFLRCSCLLFHFMTDVEFPDQFCDSKGDTFDTMCKYLGLLPDIETYFDDGDSHLSSLELFASHPDFMEYNHVTKTKLNGSTLEIVPCVSKVRQLITLPDDYSDLINSVSDFTCPNNGKEESRNPTMCLVCGTILCAQSYCCQPILDKVSCGACTHHAHFCGAGIGMFLRIRDCEILFLGLNKGCFFSPPYLDEYGETDQGLRRGNPLRLCHERYRNLHLMWLGHGLHEEIARFNESPNSVITQWQHM